MRWKAVAAALVALWVVHRTAAQESQPQPDPAGQETSGSAPIPTPTPRISTIRTDRPQLQLSLAEAIQLALSKNLTTRVREVERVQALAGVESSKSGFDPLFSTTLGGSSTQRSTTSGLEATGDQIVTRKYSLGTDLSQALPVGGTFTVSLQSDRDDSNAAFALLPTAYSSSLTATLSYPLLRNRGNRSLKNPIEQAERTLDLADYQLRLETINVVSLIQNNYLDLVLAHERLKTQEQSLALAQSLLEIAQAQERVGTLAPIEVLSSEAEVAARAADIIVAESAVLEAEDVLRTSLNLPESLAMWDVAVVPTDAPGFPQEEYDFAQAVEQALEMRPDYQQALLNLKILRLNLELSRDRVQPQVDLSGSWGFLGNSQLTTVLDPDGDPQQVAQGGVFSSHLEDLLSFDNFTWSIGVNVRQALGNRAALGQYRSDKLAIERALLQLRNLELSIVSEVRSLLRAIETNKKRVAATRISTELAKRRLEAEQKKFEVGTATSFNVSQFQERYVAAETAQTQAIIDLNRSVLSLQQALGMTLEANSIRIENGQPVLGPAAEPRPRPNP